MYFGMLINTIDFNHLFLMLFGIWTNGISFGPDISQIEETIAWDLRPPEESRPLNSLSLFDWFIFQEFSCTSDEKVSGPTCYRVFLACIHQPLPGTLQSRGWAALLLAALPYII